jgi:hypothetical protein
MLDAGAQAAGRRHPKIARQPEGACIGSSGYEILPQGLGHCVSATACVQLGLRFFEVAADSLVA